MTKPACHLRSIHRERVGVGGGHHEEHTFTGIISSRTHPDDLASARGRRCRDRRGSQPVVVISVRARRRANADGDDCSDPCAGRPAQPGDLPGGRRAGDAIVAVGRGYRGAHGCWWMPARRPDAGRWLRRSGRHRSRNRRRPHRLRRGHKRSRAKWNFPPRQSSLMMKPACHLRSIHRERVGVGGGHHEEHTFTGIISSRTHPDDLASDRGRGRGDRRGSQPVVVISASRAPASERRRRLPQRPLRRAAGPAWRSRRRKVSRGRASSPWAAAGGRATPCSSGWRRRAPRTPRPRRWPPPSCRIGVNSLPASPTRTTGLGTCCRLCK